MRTAAKYRELAQDARRGRDNISTPILRRALNDLVDAYERQADAMEEWQAADALAGFDLPGHGRGILVSDRKPSSPSKPPRSWESFVIPALWERDDSDSDRRRRASEELTKRLSGT